MPVKPMLHKYSSLSPRIPISLDPYILGQNCGEECDALDNFSGYRSQNGSPSRGVGSWTWSWALPLCPKNRNTSLPQEIPLCHASRWESEFALRRGVERFWKAGQTPTLQTLCAMCQAQSTNFRLTNSTMRQMAPKKRYFGPAQPPWYSGFG